MALEIKLSQKLSQSLVMTPQLQQAIKLLQLGRMEYLEMLTKELLENPVLEDAQLEGQAEVISKKSELAAELPGSVEDLGASNAEVPDLPYEDQSHSFSSLGKSSSFDSMEQPSLESTLSETEGLSSHLLWQLNTSDLNASNRNIAAQVIGNLDRDGYLRISDTELMEATACSQKDLQHVLSVLQTFDPVGVCARSIGECLQIQLENIGRGDSLSAVIVRDHLVKLEKRAFEQIAKEESVPVEEVYQAIKLIRTLEPRPARHFIDEPPIYIVPDVYVRLLNGNYVVSLNENGLPRLRLNSQYQDILSSGSKSASDRSYLKERIKSASWLIKSVEQRQQTILKVTESIFRFQRDFLENGVGSLKPLVLREVAQEVEMHESTVSRVTTNKYVHTAQGVFELKYFFSSGLRSDQGVVSSESVKNIIRNIIDSENQKKPFSDQAIVKMLGEQGVEIARRTVAKYRESMGVLSSSRRKKIF